MMAANDNWYAQLVLGGCSGLWVGGSRDLQPYSWHQCALQSSGARTIQLGKESGSLWVLPSTVLPTSCGVSGG